MIVCLKADLMDKLDKLVPGEKYNQSSVVMLYTLIGIYIQIIGVPSTI